MFRPHALVLTAADLRSWLSDKLRALQDEARLKLGQPIPMRLPPETPVFNVPDGLIRILDRDLVAAGIARLTRNQQTGKLIIDKRGDRGRTIDVHALRTTFGTHLSKGGVPLRTAQAAMRHSKPDLTANIYTDPKLLDIAGALDALPSLPLDPKLQCEGARATGTDGGVVLRCERDCTYDCTSSLETEGHQGVCMTTKCGRREGGWRADPRAQLPILTWITNKKPRRAALS